jgi:hypothetical protein
MVIPLPVMEARGRVKTCGDWATDAAKSLRLRLRDEFNG